MNNKVIKIAMVSSGNSVHVMKIANALVNKGYDITLYTLPGDNKLEKSFDEKVKISYLPYRGKFGYFLNMFYLRNKLKEGKYDLLNSHYASGYGTLANLTGYHPFALAVFGSDVYEFPFKNPLNMYAIVKNLDKADVITSTSHVMAAKVREFYHAEKPIYVTPFGVDISVFHPVELAKDDFFTFGIVKKIAPKYGIKTLLDSFKQFVVKHPNDKIRLLIYGTGAYEEEYKKYTDQIGLSGCVEWRGFILNSRVPEAFANMDVACFPSEKDSESFGVAAVEAMACGVPVITSDASGFTEVNENNVTGFIVKKKSVKELTEAMERMYSLNQEDRDAMGRAGIDRVKRLYNFEDNIQTYIEAIQKAFKK